MKKRKKEKINRVTPYHLPPQNQSLGGRVVSEHGDISSKSNSLSPLKIPSDNECEIPCESDLLVICGKYKSSGEAWLTHYISYKGLETTMA